MRFQQWLCYRNANENSHHTLKSQVKSYARVSVYLSRAQLYEVLFTTILLSVFLQMDLSTVT